MAGANVIRNVEDDTYDPNYNNESSYAGEQEEIKQITPAGTK